MWQILLKCDEGNYLMASSASKSRIERDSGMVHGHAYSVLHAVEIEGLRLVCFVAGTPGATILNGMDPGVIAVLNGKPTQALQRH